VGLAMENKEKEKRKIQGQGLFVFDDTADLHRAIEMSDAYYGDRSSVMELYKASGKPVMFQNVGMVSSLFQESMICPTIIFENEEYMWLCETTFASLYLYSKTKKIVEKTFYFDKTNEKQGYLFHRAVEVNDKIYFSPLASKYIGVFDKKSNRFSLIPFDDSFTGLAFLSAFVYGDNVYFTPLNYPAFMKLNTLTLEISFINDWFEQIIDDLELSNDFLCSQGIQISEDTFAVTTARTNAVIIYNMKTNESFINKIGKKEWKYKDVCFDGKDFWLLPRRNAPIVRWNRETNKLTEYYSNYLSECGDKFIFYSIEFFDNLIWILPNAEDFALSINPKNGEIKKLDELNDIWGFRMCSPTKMACVTSWVNDSFLCVFDSKSGELIKIGHETVIHEKILPPTHKKWHKRYRMTHIDQIKSEVASIAEFRCRNISKYEFDLLQKREQYEQKKFTLDYFIELVLSNDYNDCGNVSFDSESIVTTDTVKTKPQTDNTNDGMCGKRIYDFIKQQVMNN
jgi:hypothetical protein